MPTEVFFPFFFLHMLCEALLTRTFCEAARYPYPHLRVCVWVSHKNCKIRISLARHFSLCVCFLSTDYFLRRWKCTMWNKCACLSPHATERNRLCQTVGILYTLKSVCWCPFSSTTTFPVAGTRWPGLKSDLWLSTVFPIHLYLLSKKSICIKGV